MISNSNIYPPYITQNKKLICFVQGPSLWWVQGGQRQPTPSLLGVDV